MNFLKQLGKILTGSSSPGAGTFHTISVRCNRCGEVLQTKINLFNDLSVEYDEKGNVIGYVCRKVLQGTGSCSQLCFQPVDVSLRFDSNRTVTECRVLGGKLVEGE